MPVRLFEKGGVVVIDLEGEVRLSEESTPAVHELVVNELRAGKKDFLLNFKKVDFVDSYAVGELIAAYVAVRAKKGRLKLACPPPKVWMVFRYSGLTQVMDVFDSEEKALKSFT
jgi:anti-anti-sigma factor